MENVFGVCVGFLLVFGFFISSGDGIKCFQCTSASDPGCADLKKNDTNSKYYRECSDNHGLKPFFCRKTSLLLLDSQTTRITRSCGTIINRKNESNCYRADTDFKAEISCQCFDDACNSISQIKPTLLLPLLVTVILYYVNM